ncbi:universal stress protein [Streptomyces sp. S.PB5]|uniref:universal stress protein n=1 Tax=Streptomyces sp. S.PB5 TaxID=3020844 RepID=UPI0025B13690|nr:universal stress protein [Streptomyces sp. S.PB5]MDN3029207.1 universal stress protein [Streptomyces sp. S.PB5]
MELPLVVGVDGSDESLVAVDWAADEAARRGLPLRLVHASLWERYEGAVPPEDGDPPYEQVRAENLLDIAAARARRRAPDLKVATEVAAEEAVDALLHEGHHAFSLVTGARDRGGLTELLLGSVSPAVAGRARCPVIVVRGDTTGDHGRILLGVGESARGGEAVRFAFQEAETRGCMLDAVRAWRRSAREPMQHPLLAGNPAHQHERQASEQLDSALYEAAADHPAVRVRRTTAEGPAPKVLLARSGGADLLVVGARRRHGHHGFQLGRVAHTLLHHADCPVAVVPEEV